MHTYAVGFDFGNSETCSALLINGNMLTTRIPSVTALANIKKFQALGNTSFDRDEYVYTDETTELYIGNLALEQTNSASSGIGDIERYASSKALQLLLTSSASLTKEAKFGVNVVTGLPILTYIGNGDLRKNMIRTLNGVHDFTLNGKQRSVEVTVSTIVMEGAGAMVMYGNSKTSEQAVIDIGGRTTDLYVTRGQKPIETKCSNIPLGVEKSATRVNERFENMYHRPLTQYELKEIFSAYVKNRKALPVIKVDGMPVTNVRELVTQAINEVAKEIVSFISSVWNVSETGKVASGFDSVIIIGGGSYYFGEVIKAKIPHAVIVENPEMANAVGYAKVAERTLQRQMKSA
jgi:plasmid segregation protein ParM